MIKTTYTILLLFLVSLVQAQEFVPRPENLKHETNITQPLNVRKGFLRCYYTFGYMPYDSYFNNTGKRTKLQTDGYSNISGVSSYNIMNLFSLEYGITDHLELEVALPFTKQEADWQVMQENVPDNFIDNDFLKHEEASGISDLSLYLRYQFIEKDDLFAVGALGAWLPFGKPFLNNSGSEIEHNPSNNRDKPVMTGVLWVKKIYYPLAVELRTDYLFYFENDRQKSSASFATNGQCGILLNDWFSLNNFWEYSYIPPITYKEDGDIPEWSGKSSYRLSTGVSIIQQLKQFRFEERIKFPIMGKDIPTNMDLMFSIYYTF